MQNWLRNRPAGKIAGNFPDFFLDGLPFVVTFLHELMAGIQAIVRNGVTIQADQRDRITEIIEETLQNLRKNRLVI